MEVGLLVVEVDIRVREELLPRYKLHVRLSENHLVTVNGDYLQYEDGVLIVWERNVVAGIFAAGKWLSIVRGDAIPEKEEDSK